MATATAAKPAEAEAPAPKKKGRKVVVVALLLLVVGAAAAYFLVVEPSKAAASDAKGATATASASASASPALGTVLPVDAISINLADGHYLKIGLALQETADATEVKDGSRALDAAIELYSGRPMADLQDPTKRAALKAQLVSAVKKDYDDKVVDVYFTEYVMQ